MPTVVVPIGFESGPRWLAGELHYEVLLPREFAKLPPDIWKVWWSAFADVEGAANLSLTRARLVEIGTKLEISSTEQHVDALFADQLLVELDTDSPAEFFRRHKLHPLADGFGAIENEPGVFQIAREGKVLIEVNIDVYAVWCLSAYYSSIWETIETYAAEVQTGADEVAVSVARALPLIVANRCGFLQPA